MKHIVFDGYLASSEFCKECLKNKKKYCEKYMQKKLCLTRKEVD